MLFDEYFQETSRLPYPFYLAGGICQPALDPITPDVPQNQMLNGLAHSINVADSYRRQPELSLAIRADAFWTKQDRPQSGLAIPIAPPEFNSCRDMSLFIRFTSPIRENHSQHPEYRLLGGSRLDHVI